MADDADLLDAWAAGDRDAGGQFAQRHFDGLYRFFRAKIDDSVDDFVHDALIACLEARRAGTKMVSARAYLYATARNRLYDHLRGKLVRGQFDPLTTTLEHIKTSPSGILARADEQRLLVLALATLPLDFQTALQLYYWESLSGAELAEVLGVPEGTARSRVRRAKEALGERIAELEAPHATQSSTLDRLDHWTRSLRDCVA